MTEAELIAYYADLLILQYREKPKAYATVQTLVKEMIMSKLGLDLIDAFNVDTAVGVQLDMIGKIVGVSRTALTYSGAVTLVDSDYRQMIRMKIVLNNSASTLAEIQALIQTFFPGAIQVFDHQNMRMSYFFNSSLGSVDLAEAFVRQGLLPKPMGVQLATLVYASGLTNLFGWSDITNGINTTCHGFNTVASYDTSAPWLTIADGL